MGQQAIFNATPSLVPFGAFGPRATPLTGSYPVSTLVLGLGQVGWHAVSLFSNMLNAGIASSESERIQYLAIARRPAVIPAGWLYPDNYLPLTLSETDWEQVPNHYTVGGVARWWPKPPRDQSMITDPTTMARSYGRLLLFDNPAQVVKALRDRTFQLRVQSTLPGSDGRRLILLLASIAEAEGSAMLLDIALMLRLNLANDQTTIAAVLTTNAQVPNDSARTLAEANVYATLKEIDAIMVNPTQYQLGYPGNTGSLTRMGNIRLLDYVLLTGDATTSTADAPPPAAAIAEMAFTWLQINHGRPESPLPTNEALSPNMERFDGYTMFNVSKLGLPVSGVVDLLAADLAHRVLVRLLTPESESAIPQWANGMVAGFQQEFDLNRLLNEPTVRERWRDIVSKTSADAILPEIEKSRDKPDFNLEQIGYNVIQLLDIENETNAPSDTGLILDDDSPVRRLATLRVRVEDALTAHYARLEPQLAELPAHLTCLQGHSLHWMIAALDALIHQFDALHDQYCQQAVAAEQAWQDARQRALDSSVDYDRRYTGIKRRLRGFNNADLQELLHAYGETAQCLAEYIHWTSSAIIWQRLRETTDRLQQETRIALQQAEQTLQSMETYTGAIRQAINDAIQQKNKITTVQAPVNSDWFQKALAQIAPQNDMPPDDLLRQVFSLWRNERSLAECQLEQFLQDLMPVCRHLPVDSLQITSLLQYLLEPTDSPIVRQGIQHFQKAAIPQWLPYRESTGWTAHEWLRANTSGTMNLSLLSPGQGDMWQRLNVESGDPDELCLIRMVHKVTAESIEQLRGPYRRAYERLCAEGVPMHLDRQWDSMLADLIPNTILRDVSALWESMLRAWGDSRSDAIRKPLSGLIRLFATVLHVDPAKLQNVPVQANDFLLIVFDLPPSRLQLPPRRCPVVFTFSKRPPEKLGLDMYRAITGLGFAEHFAFVVNLTNRRDLKIATGVFDEGFNVVVIDEANFKNVVSAPEPRRALDKVVITAVDLTRISPFNTKSPVPERMFFGRERELADVRAKIPRHSVALYGGRRIGKTSTLQHLERILQSPDSGYIPYYLDCSNATSYTHFFNAIRRRWEISTATPDPTAFEDIVADLKARHPQQLVFLFDEVDRLLMTDREQKDSELLFRTFRALSNENRCQFILSGERWLSRTMMNADSALFNFALPVPLTLLEKATVERLIVEPFEMMNIWLEDTPALVDRIYTVSAGHPNIVQMICQEMVEAVNADPEKIGLLNMGHLEHALTQHKLQEEMVNTFWGAMCNLARLITLLWPPDQQSLSLEQIIDLVKNAGLPSVAILDMQEAMKNLELYCFVNPRGVQYDLIPTEFPSLIRAMTIEKMEIEALVDKIKTEPEKARSA